MERQWDFCKGIIKKKNFGAVSNLPTNFDKNKLFFGLQPLVIEKILFLESTFNFELRVIRRCRAYFGIGGQLTGRAYC